MKKETIVANTMREFKEGKLRSSSGDKVTDRDQAIAIALSKSGQSKYAKGGYVVQYDPEKKKTITRTKKEADDFVEVLKKNGHTLIEVFKVGEESKSKSPASKTDGSDIDDALTGAKTLLKFASASDKKEIETFIKGLEILKKMSGESKTPKPEKMKTMSLSKDRDYVKEAKEYFIDAGFIDELDTDERFYVNELIKGISTPYRSKTEIEANQYFIENEMADQLTKDKQFYVVKLIENSKKKPKAPESKTIAKQPNYEKAIPKIDYLSESWNKKSFEERKKYEKDILNDLGISEGDVLVIDINKNKYYGKLVELDKPDPYGEWPSAFYVSRFIGNKVPIAGYKLFTKNHGFNTRGKKLGEKENRLTEADLPKKMTFKFLADHPVLFQNANKSLKSFYSSWGDPQQIEDKLRVIIDRNLFDDNFYKYRKENRLGQLYLRLYLEHIEKPLMEDLDKLIQEKFDVSLRTYKSKKANDIVLTWKDKTPVKQFTLDWFKKADYIPEDLKKDYFDFYGIKTLDEKKSPQKDSLKEAKVYFQQEFDTTPEEDDLIKALINSDKSKFRTEKELEAEKYFSKTKFEDEFDNHIKTLIEYSKKKPSKDSKSKYTLDEAKKFFIESGKIDEVSPDTERLIRALIDQDKSPIRTEDELYAEKSLLPNITNWSDDWKYHITNLISLSKNKKGEMPKSEKRYTYALTSRPFDIGTYPKENFVRFVYEEEDNYKFGLLEYSEPIPDRDLKHYSLAPVSELNQYNEKLFEYFDGNIGQAFIKKTVGNIPYVKVDLYDDPNEEAIETIDLSGYEFLSKIKSGDYKILENQSKLKDTDGENHLKKKQNLQSIKKEIIDFVEKNSWFELDDDSDDTLLFATRENGNVGSESPGSKDIAEAKRLKQELEKKFKGLVKIELEVVDEWVHINIDVLPLPFAKGGVIGQEIVFDDNGEENKGVIKDIHEITGDYIVATDDGRTVLASKELDVISLGNIRKKPMEVARKRFGFFEDGGVVENEISKMAFDDIIFLITNALKEKTFNFKNNTYYFTIDGPSASSIYWREYDGSNWSISFDNKYPEFVFIKYLNERYKTANIKDVLSFIKQNSAISPKNYITGLRSIDIRNALAIVYDNQRRTWDKRLDQFANGGSVPKKETILWAVKIGEPDWKEEIITTDPDMIEPAKKWAMANGFDRFRIVGIDMNSKPDFTKTFGNGGTTFSKYEIVEGYDHYKNIPLYRVTDRDEYVGEWHSNKSDAEKELSGLKNKFNDGGSVKSNTRLGEKYIYTPYIDSVYTITDKLKFGQRWILTNDKNPYETHRLNDYEIDQWIKSGKLKPINSKFRDGGLPESDRFYVRSNFGHWSVTDSINNKMIVGYSSKEDAYKTANGLNQIRDAYQLEKTINLLQTQQGYGHFLNKYADGGNVRGMDWYQMWQPKQNKVVKVGDIVVHQHSKQPYKIIELLDDQYTVAKLDGNKEVEWKTFYEDFEDHKMFMPQQFGSGGTTLSQYIWNNHDLMIKGRYKVTGDVEAEVVVAGWEVGGSGKDEYLSMYQPSLEQNPEIMGLNVKRPNLRKMSNGIVVPATTGTGKKVKIQRIGGIYFRNDGQPY